MTNFKIPIFVVIIELAIFLIAAHFFKKGNIMTKYEIKEKLNRIIRINEIFEFEDLSASATKELQEISDKLKKEIKEIQDAGGVV